MLKNVYILTLKYCKEGRLTFKIIDVFDNNLCAMDALFTEKSKILSIKVWNEARLNNNVKIERKQTSITCYMANTENWFTLQIENKEVKE